MCSSKKWNCGIASYCLQWQGMVRLAVPSIGGMVWTGNVHQVSPRHCHTVSYLYLQYRSVIYCHSLAVVFVWPQFYRLLSVSVCNRAQISFIFQLFGNFCSSFLYILRFFPIFGLSWPFLLGNPQEVDLGATQSTQASLVQDRLRHAKSTQRRAESPGAESHHGQSLCEFLDRSWAAGVWMT